MNNKPKSPPRPPAQGCVKIVVEGKEAVVEQFRNDLEKIYGLRFAWDMHDSTTHQGCKWQRLEVQVLQ
jgi:hypothetical protein